MTVEKPAMTLVPGSSANAYADRHGYAPEAICLHIMQGTLAGCDSWFKNPAAQAGAHFGIGKGGEIHMYYPLDQAPFANGVVETGHTAKIIDANPGANVNWLTVSLEHEGNTGDALTPKQFDASTRVSAWVFDSAIFPGGATGVAVDRDHVIRHADVSPLSRPNCPGFSSQMMADYIARVRVLLNGYAPPLPPVVIDQRITDGINDITALALGFAKLRDEAAVMEQSARAAVARLARG